MRKIFVAVLLLGFALRVIAPLTAQDFDLVIVRGRVIDPESGLDAVRSVGIKNGKIAAIADGTLTGREQLDATGLVVAPGFIDLHSHGQTDETYRCQVQDGVTTAFELEVGAGGYRPLVSRTGARAADQLRRQRRPYPGPHRGDARSRARSCQVATPRTRSQARPRLRRWRRLIDEGLRKGAVAMGLGPSYTAAATQWEVLEMIRVAGRHHASVHVHIRGGMAGLEEVIAGAALTGAPLHVVHINSSGLAQTREMLQVIAEARAHGLDVTTEAYPYTAGMTEIKLSELRRLGAVARRNDSPRSSGRRRASGLRGRPS